MEIRYEIIESKERCETGEVYIGYGLKCSMGGETALAENISPHRESVERLAAVMEREGVEPVHLLDVVYDLLAEGGVS